MRSHLRSGLGLRQVIDWMMYVDRCVDSEFWDTELGPVARDELMSMLFAYGNFGRKQGSGNKVQTVTTAFRTEGVFGRLQRAGEFNWSLYKHHSWLRPFCWLYQAFRYMGQGLKTKRNSSQLREDARMGNARYELLRKLNIQ